MKIVFNNGKTEKEYMVLDQSGEYNITAEHKSKNALEEYCLNFISGDKVVFSLGEDDEMTQYARQFVSTTIFKNEDGTFRTETVLANVPYANMAQASLEDKIADLQAQIDHLRSSMTDIVGVAK